MVAPLKRKQASRPIIQEVNPAPSAEVVGPPVIEVMDEEIEGDEGKDEDKAEGEDNAPVEEKSPEPDERVPKKKKKKKKSKSKSKSKSPEDRSQANPSISTQPAVVISTETSKDDPPKVVEETDRLKEVLAESLDQNKPTDEVGKSTDEVTKVNEL